MKIALAGNPNSGKTTMYNALTGASENVGNWAGVTVEKKEAFLKKSYSDGEQITVVDLPGAYSMSPYTSEESVTREYVTKNRPDVIINIVDATNLSRSLFFTTQLLELGIPVIVALNKSDAAQKNGTVIDDKELARRLGCNVAVTVSTKKNGLDELIKRALAIKGARQDVPFRDRKIAESKAEAQELDKERFAFVNNIVDAVQKQAKDQKPSLKDRLDNILTNRFFGIPIFAAVMFLVFYISQTTLGTWIAEGVEINGKYIPGLVYWLELLQESVRTFFEGTPPILNALLVDGVIGGAIAVIGFLPLVTIMYFLIALLEDCGYMARVAVLLDPIFKRVGLSGRSVIPFVISVGCAVPGIMASRTIRSEREKRATAMLAPFMPCGAKIPVIALIAGVFFDNAGWISTLAYLMGIIIIFIGALIINAVTGFDRKRSYFIIEIPDYKMPSFSGAIRTACSRGWAYIVKAATVILLCNTAVQLIMSFDITLAPAESADSSILALLAKPFAYVLYPLVGVVSWQLAAATVTGFIAKENVVGTLAVCFVGLDNLIDAEEFILLEGSAADAAGIMAITRVAALAYLALQLFSPPCFAAIGAMNSEISSKKWFFGGIALQLGTGYTIAYLIYTVGTLLTDASALSPIGAIAGGCVVGVFLLTIVLLTKKARRNG